MLTLDLCPIEEDLFENAPLLNAMQNEIPTTIGVMYN